jgi:hypothetical protein
MLLFVLSIGNIYNGERFVAEFGKTLFGIKERKWIEKDLMWLEQD